jgi:hypothetical protein
MILCSGLQRERVSKFNDTQSVAFLICPVILGVFLQKWQGPKIDKILKEKYGE